MIVSRICPIVGLHRIIHVGIQGTRRKIHVLVFHDRKIKVLKVLRSNILDLRIILQNIQTIISKTKPGSGSVIVQNLEVLNVSHTFEESRMKSGEIQMLEESVSVETGLTHGIISSRLGEVTRLE